MPLTRAMRMVTLFHRVFSHPIAAAPTLLSPERVKARADWISKEVQELRDATTIHEQADAFLDQIYCALGGLVEMGVDPSPLLAIVQGANMAKVWPDGSVRVDRANGNKVLKPPEWRDPGELLAEEINRQIEDGNLRLFGSDY